MPLPYDRFQGKGVLDFTTASSSCLVSCLDLTNQRGQIAKNTDKLNRCCYVPSEATSVLDTISSSPSLSPLASFSGDTLAAGNSKTTTATTTDFSQGSGDEKCGQMEDWETVLSGSSANGEQSIFKLMMGGFTDPSNGFNKIADGSGQEFEEEEFNAVAGFGMVDQGLGFDSASGNVSSLASLGFPFDIHNQNGSRFGSNSLISSNQNLFHQQSVDEFNGKAEILNRQVIINQNPGLFSPVANENYSFTATPPSKRLNSAQPGLGPNNYNQFQQQRPNSATDDQLANEQMITNQLFKIAELIGSGPGSGNLIHAQEILARLNHHHQFFSAGNSKTPFHKAASYFNEALQSVIQNNGNFSASGLVNYNLIFKISAYKSFTEISPVLQFANFTCNQALLESVQGFNKIHIIDFDIGYGGQWSSLMQDLVLANRSSGPPPSLKITAFVSQVTHNGLELGFTQENLINFAREVNIFLEIEILSLESLTSTSYPRLLSSDDEGIAVNLPISCFGNYPSFMPSVLQFVKQVSPKIVVSIERGCDRTDMPFAHHVIHAMQSYSAMFESLDAVNMSPDGLEKIERFLFQPEIEKVVGNRYRWIDQIPPWRNLYVQYGLSPLMFSNFAEAQAECLVQRSPIRGFHLEKRQSSLVLCWHRKELISASVWK